MKKHNKKIYIVSIVVILIIAIGFINIFKKKQDTETNRLKNLQNTREDAVIENEESEIKLKEMENEGKLENESYGFSLTDDEIFHGDASDGEMGDYQLCFFSSIDDFTELHIGKGIEGEPWGWYLAIDKENITVYDKQNDKVVAQYPHEMKFEDYIGINIIADLRATATIEISTSGGNFRKTEVPWKGVNGTLFAETVGENSMPDAKLSYYCNGWKKNIWLFGDSYFDMAAEDRWTSYLTENGASDILLNGYSGRNSQTALESLKKELNFGVPEKIIWCMGMNDGDADDAINENWEKATEEVMEICKNNDIELILATIPNCPYWYNEYKNEYVKSSGYRYIDFAKSVGAYDNIEWIDGMLEEGEKRIHPTEAGAIALYHEAVSVVPELLR